MLFVNLLWCFICGVSNRIRGGWLQDYIKALLPFWADTPARLFVTFMISTPLYYSYNFWEAFFFNILLYIGFIFRWSPWNIMSNPLRDIPCLTLRGMLLTLPAGYFMDIMPFALCGASMGIVYYTSWHIHPYHKDPNGYVWNGSDWGEVYFGIILGAFLVFSIT